MKFDAREEHELEQLALELLQLLGEDPDRPGIIETPGRVARAWLELVRSPKEPPPPLKMFAAPRDAVNQMIVSKGIPMFSLCEHHMLPFYGTVSVGWLPGSELVGLSKIDRVVTYFARALNTQETLGASIGDYLYRKGRMRGVIVHIRAVHMCKMMRGARSSGEMITTAIFGDIDKSEFLASIS